MAGPREARDQIRPARLPKEYGGPGRQPGVARSLAALAYFSLGDEAEEASRRYLLDYYRFVGDFASQIAESAHRSVSQVRAVAKGFEDAGFTELYFDPTVATLDQVDRLAEAVL